VPATAKPAHTVRLRSLPRSVVKLRGMSKVVPWLFGSVRIFRLEM